MALEGERELQGPTDKGLPEVGTSVEDIPLTEPSITDQIVAALVELKNASIEHTQDRDANHLFVYNARVRRAYMGIIATLLPTAPIDNPPSEPNKH